MCQLLLAMLCYHCWMLARIFSVSRDNVPSYKYTMFPLCDAMRCLGLNEVRWTIEIVCNVTWLVEKDVKVERHTLAVFALALLSLGIREAHTVTLNRITFIGTHHQMIDTWIEFCAPQPALHSNARRHVYSRCCLFLHASPHSHAHAYTRCA